MLGLKVWATLATKALTLSPTGSRKHLPLAGFLTMVSAKTGCCSEFGV